MSSNLVAVRDVDIVEGAEFRCSIDCCTVTVLSVYASNNGTKRVAFEMNNGFVGEDSFAEFKNDYRRKPKHDLKKGDIFVINDEYGKNKSGLVFLYENDKNVVRLGKSQDTGQFGSYMSYCDLAYYLRRLGGGNYDNIEKINNLNSAGITLS